MRRRVGPDLPGQGEVERIVPPQTAGLPLAFVFVHCNIGLFRVPELQCAWHQRFVCRPSRSCGTKHPDRICFALGLIGQLLDRMLAPAQAVAA